MSIFDPTEDQKEIAALAKARGFWLQSTGGGCTAWELTGKKAFIWLTEGEDSSAGTDPREPFFCGIYWVDAEGSIDSRWACTMFPNFERAAEVGAHLLDLAEKGLAPRAVAATLKNSADASAEAYVEGFDE